LSFFFHEGKNNHKKRTLTGSCQAPALPEAETLRKVQSHTAQLSSAARVQPVINIYISYQIRSSAADFSPDFRQVTKSPLICPPACRERCGRQGAGQATRREPSRTRRCYRCRGEGLGGQANSWAPDSADGSITLRLKPSALAALARGACPAERTSDLRIWTPARRNLFSVLKSRYSKDWPQCSLL